MKTWKNRFQKVLAILLAICLVTGCMGASKVQAATSKSGTTYYYTWLHRQKGGVQVYSGKKYYMTGTMKATCKGIKAKKPLSNMESILLNLHPKLNTVTMKRVENATALRHISCLL